jgi:hypothetical protein
MWTHSDSLRREVQCVYALVYAIWCYVTEREPFMADFEIDFRLEVESGVFFCWCYLKHVLRSAILPPYSKWRDVRVGRIPVLRLYKCERNCLTPTTFKTGPMVTSSLARHPFFSHSRLQKILPDCIWFSLLWISWQFYFTEQCLPFSNPQPGNQVHVSMFPIDMVAQVIPPRTGFPFCRLLRLSGLLTPLHTGTR